MKLLAEFLTEPSINEADELRGSTTQQRELTKNIISNYVDRMNAEKPENMGNASVKGVLNTLVSYARRRHPIKLEDRIQGIDVRPLARELAKARVLRQVGPDTYTVANSVLGDLMSGKWEEESQEYANTGTIDNKGARTMTKFEQGVARGGRGYKLGQDKSGEEKNKTKATIKNNDEAWGALTDGDKAMVDKLSNLSNPSQAFKALKYIVRLQRNAAKTKKNYSTVVNAIEAESSHGGEFADALSELKSAGIVAENGTVNHKATQAINNVVEFMGSESSTGITPTEKITAFLPKFIQGAIGNIRSTGVEHLKNDIVKNPVYKGPLDAMNTPRFTDDVLTDILNSPRDELSPTRRKMRYIARVFKQDTVDGLRDAIATKMRLRRDHAGDENKAAVSLGRSDEFKKLFSL
jgi:hypothetical protein